MKKFGILCAGLAVAIASQAKAAPVVDTNNGLSIWYDVRSTAAAITTPAAPYTVGTSLESLKGPKVLANNVQAGNQGGPGDAQILWMSPRLPQRTSVPGFGLHWTGKKAGSLVNQSVKSLYKYATVETRGGSGEVIGALGLNTDITKGGTAGAGNKIESVVVVANGSLWNNNNNSVSPVGDGYAITTKAVKVPVSDNGGTPTYNATGGAVPSATPYQLGSLTITANVWQKPATSVVNSISDSTYSVKDSVNNLLVTRVYNGTGPTPEDPDFGYTSVITTDVAPAGPSAGDVIKTGSNGGIPEGNNGDGVTVGTTSAEADATIFVQPKGDFNNDNLVSGLDNPFYNAAVIGSANNRQREIYLGDFSNDGVVNGLDNPGYNEYVVVTAGSSCAVPANCP